VLQDTDLRLKSLSTFSISISALPETVSESSEYKLPTRSKSPDTDLNLKSLMMTSISLMSPDTVEGSYGSGGPNTAVKIGVDYLEEVTKGKWVDVCK